MAMMKSLTIGNFTGEIPSKTSDLTNDSGFVDAAGAAAAAPVQSVNSKTGAVTLSASDVGAATSESVQEINSRFADDPAAYSWATPTLSSQNYKFIRNTGEVVASNNWIVKKLAINPATNVVKTDARTYNDGYWYAWYDSTDTFISGEKGAVGGGSQSMTRKTIKPPVNASYLLIQTHVSFPEIPNCELGTYVACSWATPTLTSISGKFINSSAQIVDSASWILKKLTVDPSLNLVKTDARTYGNGYWYAWYDSTDTFISGGQGVNGGGSQTMTRQILIPPSNAAYILIQTHTSYPQIPDCELGTYIEAKLSMLKKWSGKKWVVFGDSLTEENSRTTKHYFDYVSEVTGISIHNMGNSGSGYMQEQDLGTAFYQRIGSVPLDTDVITIFGSFNDMNHFSDLGTATDSGTTTIGGCINETLDTLFATLPLANIGIVTPTPWVYQNPTTEPNNASAYVDLLITIAKMRSIPCLDLFHCSQLRPWDATFRTLAYSKDEGNGVHPDETGHKIIAPRFEAFLDSLLLH